MTPLNIADRISDYANAIRYSARHEESFDYTTQAWRIWKARFKYGIGARLYSLFDLRYVDERNWPDYIIDEPFKLVQRAASSLEARLVADNKLAFFNHCERHKIPTIPVVGLMSHKPDIQKYGVPFIGSPDALASLFELHGQSLFFKLIDGSHGRNAFVARRTGDAYKIEEVQLTLAEFFDYCQAQIKEESGWLIQPVAANHADMLDYMAGGLGTVRVVTFMEEGKPQVMCACLRITCGSGVADNFSHGRSGNLVAAVQLDTGRLGNARGSTRLDWPVMKSYTNHPSRGVTIDGREVPYWQETLELVKQAHKSLLLLKIIGWDVGITDRGPILVEANSTSDVDLLQVACQRGFRPWFNERHFKV